MDYRNDYRNDSMRERQEGKGEGRSEADLLMSKVVKAGKRTYFIDVKRDRRGECYLQLTESKRLREQAEDGRPMYEKHKIFLYQEDFAKFYRALNEAADFAARQSPESGYFAPWRNTGGANYDESEMLEYDAYSGESDNNASAVDFKLNVDF